MATLFTDPRPPLLPIPAAVQVAGVAADRARDVARAEAAMWADVRAIARLGGLRGRAGMPDRRRYW